MKTLKCVLASLFAAGNIAAFAQTNSAGEADFQGIKEQISLPPEVIAFIAAKEQQANDIAQNGGFTLPDDFKNFIADAKAGRAREAERWFHGFSQNAHGTNLTPALKSPILQDALDVALAYEPFNEEDLDMVMALGHDLMNSLPAGCIYFGGTDAGRGLPTMLCKSPGDPVHVLTQNALCDGRYMQYVREMYGTRIKLPDTNEVQQCFDGYIRDAQERLKKNQLLPGENFRMENGKPKFEGQISVMKINGFVAATIFFKNPDPEFYVQQSAPLDWMYPDLSPHGPILKVNRQPLTAISAEELQADTAYWSAKLAQLKSNPKFGGDHYAGKTYAKMRSDIAGLYVWRAQSAKDGGERQSMFLAAESAYHQALALNAAMPEAVYGFVNLELIRGKLDDALAVAKNAVAADPANGQIKTLGEQLQKFQQQQAAAATPSVAAPTKPDAAERLKQVKSLYDQGLINKDDYDKKVKEIMDSL